MTRLGAMDLGEELRSEGSLAESHEIQLASPEAWTFHQLYKGYRYLIRYIEIKLVM